VEGVGSASPCPCECDGAKDGGGWLDREEQIDRDDSG
jgi:hypothetical protein